MDRFRSHAQRLAVAATLIAPCASLIAFLLPATLAYSQATGTISGTVQDSSGAIVPNAAIVFHNTETSTDRNTTSDGAGLYTLQNLQPGSYVLTASAPGFGAIKQTVIVNVGTRVDIDIKLPISSASEVVEVTTDTSVQVNTATPEVSQVITQQQVSQLPSLTRNPYDFVSLSGNISAGDNTSAGGYQNGATTNRGANGFSLNGSRASGTEVLLDGVENLSVFTDQIAITVPLDDVQEYRIITNNFAPEYGRASGGVVAVATRAGTNAFHGRIWEFNRLSAYTANTVTNAQSGVPKSSYTRNQFGGAIGGPVLKDKLFFFSSAELTRVRSASNIISAVPDPALLAVAAPNVQSFFNTYGAHPNFNVNSTTTNAQAGGGSPLYAGLAPSAPVYDNVLFTAPADAGGGLPQNTYNVTGRLDYDLSAKTQAFFRYVDYNEVDLAGAAYSSPYSQYNVGATSTGEAYLLSVAHEFTPALSTLTKLSFTRNNLAALTYNAALGNVPTLNVYPGGVDPNTGNTFELPGFFSPTPGNGGLPSGGPQNTIQYNQDLSLTKGRHQLQFGAQVLYIQENNSFGAYAQANEQLGKNQSQGLANFATGNLYQFQAAVNPQGATPCALNQYTNTLVQTPSCTINLPVTQPSFARSDRFHDWAAYTQDQWKATPRLTVSYGVRYEYFGVQHNNNAALDSNFYYGSGSSLQQEIRNGNVLTVPNSPNKRLWNPQYGDVSPRVGLALDLFGNGKTSLRGGYGISYERNFGNVTFNVIQNPPNYAVIVDRNGATVTNSNSGPLAGTGAVPLPPTSLRHVDQNIRTAQTQFHSLAIDQQLGHNTLLEVAYNGSRGVHLYDIKNYNIPGSGNLYLGDPLVDPVSGNAGLTSLNPHFSNDNNRGSNGDSYYNAVNVQLTAHDVRHTGLSIVANYTLGHALDDLSTTFSETYSGNFSLGYTDPFNPSFDHGNSDLDIRHRFVVAPIYETPWYNHRKGGYLAQALFGWQANGIYTLRTGTPFTLYDSTYNSSGYSIPRYNPSSPVHRRTFKSIPSGSANNGNLYTLTGATDLPVNNPYINPVLGISDFGPYPATMDQRNSFRGPGAYNLDASVSKTIPIHEQVNVEFRAEGFDITNHHNLYILGQALDAGNFQATTTTTALGSTVNNPATNPQIQARKGGVQGGPNDERRFGQFALKVNF